jgi:DNA-binding transcriptional MerR regulator
MMRNASIRAADATAAERVVRHHPGTGSGGAAARDDVPMTIREVARQFGITLRALRFYEAKRLIAPQRRGALRIYRRSDRERLTLILAGRRLGFTLAEIRDLLGKPDGKTLQLTREQCVAQINALEQQKRNIEIAIAELRQIYSSFYKKLLEQAEGASR